MKLCLTKRDPKSHSCTIRDKPDIDFEYQTKCAGMKALLSNQRSLFYRILSFNPPGAELYHYNGSIFKSQYMLFPEACYLNPQGAPGYDRNYSGPRRSNKK